MVNGFMIFTGGSVSPLLRFGFSVIEVRFLRCCGLVFPSLRFGFSAIAVWFLRHYGLVSPPLRFGFSVVTDDIDDMDDNNE